MVFVFAYSFVVQMVPGMGDKTGFPAFSKTEVRKAEKHAYEMLYIMPELQSY